MSVNSVHGLQKKLKYTRVRKLSEDKGDVRARVGWRRRGGCWVR